MDLEEGDTVDIEYTTEAGLVSERRVMANVEVVEVTGEVAYLDKYDDLEDSHMVLDASGRLWAREKNKPSTDGLFGSNVAVIA